MKRLEGKVALVTGAAKGIGRGVAIALALEGADIVVNDCDCREEVETLVRELVDRGRNSLIWEADVAQPVAVQEMVSGAVSHFGHLDIVVANAAYSVREPVVEARWENVLRVIEVSQFGVFHTCQAAARQMVRQARPGRNAGKIVIIGSVHAELVVAGRAAYSMSKAAINQLGRTMAVELASYRINVNVVDPGWIDTPGQRARCSEEELERGSRRIPWRRLGTPDDIAKAVVFLASDDADYVTGATLRVDGGFALGLRYPLDD